MHFFSFFTIEANILAAAVMLIGSWLLFAKKGDDPRWFNLLRASAATYMAVTGIVYNLLLRGIELPQGSTLPQPQHRARGILHRCFLCDAHRARYWIGRGRCALDLAEEVADHLGMRSCHSTLVFETSTRMDE